MSSDLDTTAQSDSDATVTLRCTVNGQQVRADVPADLRLVAFLRDSLELTATKFACEVGVCGACTVLVDGRPTSSCITLAVQVDGAEVLTLEGLAQREEMAPLLEAFIAEGGFQCGFCTSGQLVTAAALLLSADARDMSIDDRRHYFDGNLCRCTGYYGIERAIEEAG